jgi:sialic acid synthase SpsE
MKLDEVFSGTPSGDGAFHRPCIIAEAGVNHEGKMELARRLIDEAAEAGADAIKFQTYKAETIASKDSPYYWDLGKEPTTSQYQLFKKYDKFWKNEFEALKRHADSAGIDFLSTPFDVESAAFLNDLMPVFKISASDITNKPFIKHLCSYRKPIIMSAGASYFWEAARAVEWIEDEGNPLAVLHCVLNYPTADTNANLAMIKDLKQRFPRQWIGYSDHTLPADMKILELATLVGARILEKHFTFDKSLPGNDHYHAMDKDDLARFKKALDRDFLMLGGDRKTTLESEAPARANARRSLVAKRAIGVGEKLTMDCLTWKRPASGISPADIDTVLGMTATTDIAEDDVIHWGMVK